MGTSCTKSLDAVIASMAFGSFWLSVLDAVAEAFHDS